jgi:hypothetical protein
MNRTLKDLAGVLGRTANTLAIEARLGLHESIGVARPNGRKRHIYVLYPEKIKAEFGQEVYDALYRN